MRVPRGAWLSMIAAIAAFIVPPQSAAKVVERAISLDEVPEAARATILEEAGSHEILEVEELTVDGRVFFEAEWRVGENEVEVVVTLKGEVVEREIEPYDGEDDGEDDGDARDD